MSRRIWLPWISAIYFKPVPSLGRFPGLLFCIERNISWYLDIVLRSNTLHSLQAHPLWVSPRVEHTAGAELDIPVRWCYSMQTTPFMPSYRFYAIGLFRPSVWWSVARLGQRRNTPSRCCGCYLAPGTYNPCMVMCTPLVLHKDAMYIIQTDYKSQNNRRRPWHYCDQVNNFRAPRGGELGSLAIICVSKASL